MMQVFRFALFVFVVGYIDNLSLTDMLYPR